MNKYKSPIEAFYDFVWGMNNGLTGKVYPFKNEMAARGFVDKLSSITRRRLTVTQISNQVEVHIK